MKVIITGATGMIGKAVLIECLEHKQVEKVLLISRRSLGMEHPKIDELILSDFGDLSPIEDQLSGYDACFYCMGISSVGMNEETYHKITYTITETYAQTLQRINPDMVFNYVSGSGTDSSEKGRVMWARVKGKTENMVLNMGFKDAYMFRIGAILPEKGVKSKTGWVNAILILFRPFFPLMRRLKSVSPSSHVGLAMINSLLYPQDLKLLENSDVNRLALKGR